MPPHLLLPPPERYMDRRQGAGQGARTSRNPRRHGRALTRQVEEAVRQPRSPIAEGVDPRRVFKVRTKTRVREGWSARGLEPLGESADDWEYVVITAGAARGSEQLLADLAAYAAGPDEEGARADLAWFFNEFETIEPYGPEDRRGPGIPADGFPDARTIDVELWPSPDQQEAEWRVAEVEQVLAQTEGTVLRTDKRPQLTVVRANVPPDALDALVDLTVVERIRVPPTPFLDPTDWLHAKSDELDVELIDSEPVGVIDDGVAAEHPLLQGVVRSRIDVPTDHAWAPPSEHGTMVAGLAAYGDFEEPLRDGGPLTGRPLHCARVMEPHPHMAGRTAFPAESIEHHAIESAIRKLHQEHGVRVFNLSITDPDPYSGPRVSLVTEALDRLIRELGIVCVVAAGNRPCRPGHATDADGNDYRRDYPEYCFDPSSRVAEPAVAALAVTVGSIARSAGPAASTGVTQLGNRAVADVDALSPATIAPGPNGSLGRGRLPRRFPQRRGLVHPVLF